MLIFRGVTLKSQIHLMFVKNHSAPMRRTISNPHARPTRRSHRNFQQRLKGNRGHVFQRNNLYFVSNFPKSKNKKSNPGIWRKLNFGRQTRPLLWFNSWNMFFLENPILMHEKIGETSNLGRFLFLLPTRPPPPSFYKVIFTEFSDRWCCWALAGEVVKL